MVSTRKLFHHPLSILSSGLLTGITLISAFILSSSPISATGEDVTYTSTSANASVVVSAACTMTGSGMNSHTAEVPSGTYRADIGTTTIKVTCNDPHGFSIYAIGFSNDEYTGTNHTKLIGTNDNTKTIATGTATSGSTSNWAMKLATNSGATYPITLTNGYGSYSNVPDTYTKVAQRTSQTDIGTGAVGAELTTTYAAFISSTQQPDTYVGKVRYTMVHPYDAPTPEIQPTPPVTCNTPVPNITYMQEITASNKSTVLASLTEDAPYYLRDSRDEEPYCVSKLKDGNLWLLDNLRLDLSDASILANVTASNTNASTTSLNYMKNGGGTTSDQYSTAPLNNVAWTTSNQNFYSVPMTISTYKDQTTTSYGNGSGKIGVYYNYCAASAGSYCYGSNGTSAGTSSGNATEDLCPAGWRMPTGNTADEYDVLLSDYYTDTTASNTGSYQDALSTPLSGHFYDGSATGQGNYGTFWSSTRYNKFSMYGLSVNSSTVGPTGYYYRWYGRSMRCLLQ